VSPAALAQRTRWAAWGVGLLALMAVGFLLGRQRDPRAGVHAVPEFSERAAPAAPSEPERTVPVPSTASIAPLPAVEAYIAPEEIGFRVTPGVPNDLAVQPGQGVVVIGALPGVEAATLSVDDRLRGAIPQRVALGEGIHELALQHGDATTYRFVFVRPGHTYALLAL